jgi:hypothetical protein
MSYTVPTSIPLTISMANVVSWAGTLFSSINGFVELGVGLVLAFAFIALVKRAFGSTRGRA